MTTPYRPQIMKKVIKDALSPNPTTPLLPHLNLTPDTHGNGRPLNYAATTSSSDPVSDDDITTTPLNASYFNIISPPNHDEDIDEDTPEAARVLLSSPIRFSPRRPGQDQRYEVEHSFLQAIASLIERQANIIPTSTLTKQDVKKLIRKELDAREQQNEAEDAEVDDGTFASVVTLPVVVSATAVGATAVVLLRAWTRYPQEMKWYFDGAVKGGLLGIASAMIVKGVAMGFDWLSRPRERAEWAEV
ncbi:hypothetical protein BDV96DRAFT_571852 [Lophiotrema nucula]|uniref:Uncharacterized protein n=1 Tax=Lophiotrema nucula TaxID=690887 RepID=A0A6A5ZCU4_9PLEO|nr:hypothetical protein BDV96DRAFT_571852 [Lophiotrema nucula]